MAQFANQSPDMKGGKSVSYSLNDLVDALTSLTRTMDKMARRQLLSEFPIPEKSALGRTITVDEDVDMATMKYKQMLGPLPAATGKNKDLVAAMLRVDIDGAEGVPFEVTTFDKDTRAYTGEGVDFDVPKGKPYVLGLAYKDDDDNVGDYMFLEPVVARDTIRPDAPTTQAFGSTLVVDEVEDEAPPAEEDEDEEEEEEEDTDGE